MRFFGNEIRKRIHFFREGIWQAMRGFTIIFLFLFAGEVLHRLWIPLPGNVIGLILLTLSLFMGWIKLGWIEKEAELLNRTMLLFFAPVIVGIMPLFPKYASHLLPILITLVGSTLAIMLSTGWISASLLSGRRKSVGTAEPLKRGEDRHV